MKCIYCRHSHWTSATHQYQRLDTHQPVNLTQASHCKNSVHGTVKTVKLHNIFAVMWCIMWCLFVHPSHSYILSKRIKISSKFVHRLVATPFLFLHTKHHGDIPMGTPNGGVKCRLGRQKSRFWANTRLHSMLWTRSAIHSAATDQRVDDTSRWWVTEFVYDGRRRSVWQEASMLCRRQQSSI